MDTKPRNLAQLKKYLRPGMLLTRTLSTKASESRTVPILRIQGNAFTVESPGGESWHQYSKAAAYTFTPEGFSVTLGDGSATITYLYSEPSNVVLEGRTDP